MNRAERRKIKNAKAPKTYVLTQDQIDQMKRDAVNEATRKAFIMFLSIPVMVLYDKFGFRKTRLTRFMDYALVWYESVRDDETSMRELLRVAERECRARVQYSSRRLF